MCTANALTHSERPVWSHLHLALGLELIYCKQMIPFWHFFQRSLLKPLLRRRIILWIISGAKTSQKPFIFARFIHAGLRYYLENEAGSIYNLCHNSRKNTQIGLFVPPAALPNAVGELDLCGKCVVLSFNQAKRLRSTSCIAIQQNTLAFYTITQFHTKGAHMLRLLSL